MVTTRKQAKKAAEEAAEKEAEKEPTVVPSEDSSQDNNSGSRSTSEGGSDSGSEGGSDSSSDDGSSSSSSACSTCSPSSESPAEPDDVVEGHHSVMDVYASFLADDCKKSKDPAVVEQGRRMQEQVDRHRAERQRRQEEYDIRRSAHTERRSVRAIARQERHQRRQQARERAEREAERTEVRAARPVETTPRPRRDPAVVPVRPTPPQVRPPARAELLTSPPRPARPSRSLPSARRTLFESAVVERVPFERPERVTPVRPEREPAEQVPALRVPVERPEVVPPNPFYEAVAQRIREREQQIEVAEVAGRRLDEVLGGVVDARIRYQVNEILADVYRAFEVDQAIVVQEAVQAEVERRRQRLRQVREARVARAAETQTFFGVELTLAEVADNLRWIEEQGFHRDVNNPARFWRWEGGTRGGQRYRRSYHEAFIHLALYYNMAQHAFDLHQLEQGFPRDVHNALNHGGDMPDEVDWEALFEAAVVIWNERQRAAANKAQQKRRGPNKEHSPRHKRGPLYKDPEDDDDAGAAGGVAV